MKTIECWDIREFDGCDRHNHKLFVATEAEAMKWVETHQYDEYYRKEIVVYDTVEEAMDNDLDTIRERVIKRLTPLERKAMGVDR